MSMGIGERGCLGGVVDRCFLLSFPAFELLLPGSFQHGKVSQETGVREAKRMSRGVSG